MLATTIHNTYGLINLKHTKSTFATNDIFDLVVIVISNLMLEKLEFVTVLRIFRHWKLFSKNLAVLGVTQGGHVYCV